MNIVTPSRYTVLSTSDETGNEITVEEIQDVEGENEKEEVEEYAEEDIIQSNAEENVKNKSDKGRLRQVLPRVSKTNHKVVPEATDQSKVMKRGSRKKH